MGAQGYDAAAVLAVVDDFDALCQIFQVVVRYAALLQVPAKCTHQVPRDLFDEELSAVSAAALQRLYHRGLVGDVGFQRADHKNNYYTWTIIHY